MLRDFTPNNQSDRLFLEIHDLLVSINSKLDLLVKDKSEEEVVEEVKVKTRKRRGDVNV